MDRKFFIRIDALKLAWAAAGKNPYKPGSSMSAFAGRQERYWSTLSADDRAAFVKTATAAYTD